jgi:hypothetical protein
MTDVLCGECDWHGDWGAVDHVVDPRPLPGTVASSWEVCPNCRMPEHILLACEEPDCRSPATCGWPMSAGYRLTCGNHFRELGGVSVHDADAVTVRMQ